MRETWQTGPGAGAPEASPRGSGGVKGKPGASHPRLRSPRAAVEAPVRGPASDQRHWPGLHARLIVPRPHHERRPREKGQRGAHLHGHGGSVRRLAPTLGASVFLFLIPPFQHRPPTPPDQPHDHRRHNPHPQPRTVHHGTPPVLVSNSCALGDASETFVSDPTGSHSCSLWACRVRRRFSTQTGGGGPTAPRRPTGTPIGQLGAVVV